MQSLTVCPPNSCLWTFSQVEFDLGSSLSNYRRKRGFVAAVSLFPSSGHFLVCSGSRYARRSEGCDGFLFRYPKIGFGIFVEQKEECSSPVALASCALEQQETLNLVHSSTQQSMLEDESFDVVDVTNGTSNGTQNRKAARVDVLGLGKLLHSAETADDVEEILKDKELYPIQVYSTCVRGCGWCKKMKAALAIVDWLRRKKVETDGAVAPNLLVYNNLLSVVNDCKEYKETDGILNEMAQEGIDPNVVTYNILMVIYVGQVQYSKALDVLKEIRHKGLEPSSATYSIAMTIHRKLVDGFGLLKIFVEFKERHLVNGELRRDSKKQFVMLKDYTLRICYQVIRTWLSRPEDMSTNVLKLLTDMDSAGLQPSRAEYDRLIWACTREQHYRVGKELYTRTREKYRTMPLSVCNHLIWLMGTAKKWWAALEIYEDMLEKGPKPNNVSSELVISHFEILFAAAKKRGIWRWGVRLLNTMEDKGLKPESSHWDAVLVACAKAAEASAAVEIFKRMVEKGEKPTIISYSALLSSLEKAGLYEEAFRVWNHMLKMGVKPNLYAYTTFVCVLTGLGKFSTIDAILVEMGSKGIQPTIITYNAIISGCARHGMSHAAYEWFHRMEGENISPNAISYQMLIEALVKDGKPRHAYELYLKARKDKGLTLSSKAYDQVVEATCDLTATVNIRLLGPRPPERVKGGAKVRKSWTEFTKLADIPRRGSKPFDRNEIYYRWAEKIS
ncbi:Protein LOW PHOTOSYNTHETIC EFFICIENCY 1, chloroplastic [Linum perenne]